MTPKRPTELVTASQACLEAWDKRDQFIEAGDKVGVQIMDEVTAILGESYNVIYQQWQIIGGTSDIDSLTFPAQYVDILEEQARDNDTRKTMEESRY